MGLRVLLLACALLASGFHSEAGKQLSATSLRFSVLDFGSGPLGHVAAEKLANSLRVIPGLSLVDSDQARSAARGLGYSGSLNLSVTEARDLGAALGCDFFVVGDAQTLRRSPSNAAIYFESYASIFLVSARTGKLLIWQRPSFKASKPELAEHSLLSQLESGETRHQLAVAIQRAYEDEREARALPIDTQTPVIEAAPDDEKQAEAEGLRLPRPFRRLIPEYTASAQDAEVEATIDVVVDINAKGDVIRVEVARWGGFGLDESTVSTVRRLNFFPAMREGVAVPMRVLLRYNFRKPSK